MPNIRFDLPQVPIRGPRPLPLLGARGNVIRFFGAPLRWMRGLHGRYGDIAAVSDRSPSLICAFGPAHNRQILPDARVFQNQDGGPYPIPQDSALARVLDGLNFMNGDRHRQHRRLMMPAFQKAALDGYRDDMVAVAARRLESWQVGGILDVGEEMIELTLRLAVRCLFGLDVREGEDHLGGLSTQLLELVTSMGVAALPRDLPGTPYRRMLRLGERVEVEMLELIRRKRGAPGPQRDVLSILLHARDEDGGALTDRELIGETSVLFAAGHETTASTLAWTLFLLSQHPRVLGDLLDELTGALRGDAPTVAQLSSLPLLDAVIKESMRLLPATPLLFIRLPAAEAQLGPYALPAGSAVMLSPFITHRLPDLYPDPARFRPERWARLAPSPYEYLPFGAGPRMCIGAGFAGQAVRVVLPMILQRYRLSLAHRAEVSAAVRGITLGPRRGLEMLVAPQDRYLRRAERVRGEIHELVDLS